MASAVPMARVGSADSLVQNPPPPGRVDDANGDDDDDALLPPTKMNGTATGDEPHFQEEQEVCCGCRPKSRRYHKYSTHLASSLRRALTRHGRYFDAPAGQDAEWRGGTNNNNNNNATNDLNDDSAHDSLFFFDAVDSPLDDEEYPIEGGGGYVVRDPALGDYPIVFTTALKHPAPRVSLSKPETMLRPPSTGSLPPDEGEGGEQYEQWTGEPWTGEPIESHKEPSMRLMRIKRRPTMEHTERLKMPRVKIREKGYPGELTVEELDECQKFLRGLKQAKDHSRSEQVYSFRDIEEEAYTICRWLRATKFDAAKILQRLEENQELFNEAKANEFYPDIDKAIGAPLSVFLSQYPFLAVGRGKNGCPCNFFLAGKIHPEGILCLTTIERLRSYFWYTFMWKFKDEIRNAQEADPDFVRVEGINIVDLKGLSASAMTSETMEVIKQASKVSDFFPETLHCMLVLNAPSFFAISWGLIKKFIDPRTAARIQLFANAERGQRALEKLVDSSQIPADYGGSNISLKEAFLGEASDESIIRQEIELLYCKKKGKAHTKSWELAKNETMEVTIYTRSISKANVSIKLNDSTFRAVQARCLFSDDPQSNQESATPLPNRIVAVTKNLQGPGKVAVEAVDLDTAEKKHSGLSRGYFLVVGDVKTVKPKAIPSPMSDPGSPTKASDAAGSSGGTGNKRRKG